MRSRLKPLTMFGALLLALTSMRAALAVLARVEGENGFSHGEFSTLVYHYDTHSNLDPVTRG